MNLSTLVLKVAAALLLSAATLNAQSIDNSGCCDIEIPEPFAAVPKAELIQALYPGYEEESGLLGKDAKDKQGKKLGGQIYDAAIWKGWPDPRLLVMIETYVPENGQRPEYGAAAYSLDLAAFGLQDGKPVLQVQLRGADTHSGHSDMTFDQAPYRVTPEVRAFGLRESYLHMGHKVETLKLFIPTETGFKAIFERQMVDSLLDALADPMEGDLDAEKMKTLYEDNETMVFDRQAVLRVIAGAGGANEFKVTEKRRERKPDGKLVKETISELWVWDDEQQAYVKKS